MKTLLITMLFLPFGTFAQQWYEPGMNNELSKYWFYRWRLRNDFMVMGEGAGKSMVIDTRNPEGRSLVKWADATITHGYYLSMLATEHRVLSSLGRSEDLRNNQRELYYAIKAYERLDFNTETFYSSDGNLNKAAAYDINDAPMAGSVNGYVFRDDVPPDFINEELINFSQPTSNHASLTNGKTGVKYGPSVYNKGDHENLWQEQEINGVDHYLEPPRLNEPHLPIVNHKKGREDGYYGLGEESQDQMIRLLLGFQSIVWSIPPGSVPIDLNKDGQFDVIMDFNKEARRHATNLIGHAAGAMKGTLEVPSGSVMYIPAPSQFLSGGSFWTIRTPRLRSVSVGEGIFHYMPPMQRISQWLYGPNDLNLNTPFYAKAEPTSYFAPIWETSWALGAFGYDSEVNSRMTLMLNTLSNSGNPVGRSVGKQIYMKSQGNPGEKEKDFGWHPFYIPLYDYFWHWNPVNANELDMKNDAYGDAKAQMGFAPCIGPYNFGPDPTFSGNTDQLEADGFPDYWNTPFHWDNSKNRWSTEYETTIEHGHTGFFNGLDYMLLYNLVYANSSDERPLYHDLINRIVDYPINSDLDPNLLEYSATGLLIGAFEDLQLRSAVSGNQYLEFKAMDYVELQNGFFMDPGSSGQFEIYTDTLTCGNSGPTDWTTLYRSADTCSSCVLKEGLASRFTPLVKNRIYSLRDEVQRETPLEPASLQVSEEKVTVLPNPTAGEFRLLANEEILTLKIMDGTGQLVKSYTEDRQVFSVAELANGIYWLDIELKNGEHAIQKLFKMD